MNIVGIGGSTREGSSTELLVRAVLDAAAQHGADTRLYAGQTLVLPPYEPGRPLPRRARDMIDAVRHADGLVFGSPGYHGTLSGLVKNALDYLEELAGDDRPYVDGLPVACVVTASGWQAAVNTLRALRETVHALRGWPTPLGLAVNVAEGLHDQHGNLCDPRLPDQIRAVAGQLVSFARTAERTRAVTVEPDQAGAAALVAEQVRRSIAAGRYRPGDRLPRPREVAGQLGVTVETVRRAVAALVADGIVERVGTEHLSVAASGEAVWRPERGIAEFDEIIDFRLANECVAARLAAERRTDNDLARMREALDRMHRAARSATAGGVARFHRADTEFHVAIARAARNGYIEGAVADARARLFLPVGAIFPRLAAGADELHETIMTAVTAGNGDAAAAAMAEHIEATRAAIRAVLRSGSGAVLA